MQPSRVVVAANTECVTLYRAVSEGELIDIFACGGFRQEPTGRSLESKQFAVTAHDAAWFGRGNYKLDAEAFCLVDVSLPRAIVCCFEHLCLDNRHAVNVPKEQLPELNKGTPVHELVAIPI